MLIMTIRTDKPNAEVGLYEAHEQRSYEIWPAHRQLAETLHTKIAEMLEANAITLKHIEGIVVYEGPGSFTGLRIGLSVANALAYALHIPIAGATGLAWIEDGVEKLTNQGNGTVPVIVPEYGVLPHITQQKK